MDTHTWHVPDAFSPVQHLPGMAYYASLQAWLRQQANLIYLELRKWKKKKKKDRDKSGWAVWGGLLRFLWNA